MSDIHQSFFVLAISRPVVKNAIRVAVLVGTILALINHGDKILAMSLTREQIIHVLCTYVVPYCVATYSAVRALQASS